MLKQEASSGHSHSHSHSHSHRSNGGRWSKTCDSCRTSPCAIYCRADSAYLCAGCDARIHASNSVALRHERVWVCEACEQAPAAFTCKADAAVLCTTCDTDIHSANPLARRHHRVPIMPISVGLYGPFTNRCQTTRALDMKDDDFLAPQEPEEVEEETEDEAASWLLLNPVKNNHRENNNGFLFGEGDEYLDLVEYNSCTENQFQHNFLAPHDQTNSDGSDSVVPVQVETVNEQDQQQVYQREMDYETSKPGFSYTPSMSHSVSFSSMDASIVPDNTMSDISNSHSRPPKGTIDLFSSPPLQIPPQFNPMDREARVLRYREKKKMRKFEKTIRYASRKAYAETRPRIKGRFAKRTDVHLEVEQMFSTSVMAESGYGIVPSF